MSSSFNSITVTGRLTKDPACTTTKNDNTVCNFTVAVNSWKKNRPTLFFGVQCWEKRAQTCADTLKKGSWVLVQGELFKNEWKGEDGTDRSTFKIDAKEIDFGVKEPADSSAAPVSPDSQLPPRAVAEDEVVDDEELMGVPF